MSARTYQNLAFLILCGIALLTISSVHAENSADTTRALIKIFEAQLPKGWSLSFDRQEAVLTFQRIAPTGMFKRSVNGPVVLDEKPTMGFCCVSLRVVPLVSKDEYDKFKSENEKKQKKLDALGAILWRLPGVSGMGDELWSNSTDPTVQAKLDEYHKIQRELNRLPDFYFRDISLSQIGDNWVPAEKEALNEVIRVQKIISQVLTPYKP